MKFEMETEPSPAGRPRNGRRNIVIIACAAVICVLLIIVCIKLESVNREDKGLGNEPGLRDSIKEQGGTPGAGVQPGEPELPGPTSPEGKTGPSGPAGPLDGMETLTEGIKNLTESKVIVEGIIAGTSRGIVVIPLDSREPRTISSKDTDGVAFNWHSRKVYWIEYLVGMMIADLDGSNAELLISDRDLRGLAVDQITGNLYFGAEGYRPYIVVCDSMGKKCATVASGVNENFKVVWGDDNIRDIALFPSEGLMFWSSQYYKKGVTRANMDGTNVTTIILENVRGLYLDEFTEKLYWANNNGKSIGRRDLNGYNRKVLLNTTIYPYDIAVDGDTLYFGGYNPNGVYSVTSNRKVSSIANTIGTVHHIALFGRRKVSSRQNPCNNSTSANLCVLTRDGARELRGSPFSQLDLRWSLPDL